MKSILSQFLIAVLLGGSTFATTPIPPTYGACPSGITYVRPASDGLSPEELIWLDARRPHVINALKSYLTLAGIPDFDVDEYISTISANKSAVPVIGQAYSGGGTRASMNALGFYQSFDSRDNKSMAAKLGGLSQATTYLFRPITVGPVSLQHRVVLAPLTRLKTTANLVPLLPLVKDYYTQRGSTPGTLLITESAFVAAKAGGYPHIPGIYSPEQINAWKEVVDSVHARGSSIFVQLLALGRGAMPDVLRAMDPTFSVVSASDIPVDPNAEDKPRPLTIEEIQEYVGLFVQAAKNAMEAGFDGVEIHADNGCLVDQFLQDVSNNRTDAYGGSVENRARFPLEIVQAVADAIGESKTAIRISPWSPFMGMGMKDPIPTYTHLLSELKRSHPKLAFLHVVEPRIAANLTVELSPDNANHSNDFIREIWGDDIPLISAGGYSRDSAIALADKHPNALVAFGRHFIANPDLPVRLAKDIPLHPYDRSTFYLPGVDEPTGYTDQPFATQA